MESWGGASKSGLPCMEVEHLREVTASGECSNLYAPRDNDRWLHDRSREERQDPRTYPGKRLNPGLMAQYNSSPVEYPEEFHCFRPEEEWTSPELEIPNFQVKKGCRYELDFNSGEYEDLWWTYGTRDEVLDNHSDPELVDADSRFIRTEHACVPVVWNRGFEPYITTYLRKKMMKELVTVHDYERWHPRTKLHGEPWESDEEDSRYRAWRRMYRFDRVYLQVESEAFEVV